MVLARLEELRFPSLPCAVIEQPEVPCGRCCLRASWEAADLRGHSPATFPALLVGELACLPEEFDPLLPGYIHGRGDRNGRMAVFETITRNAPLALVAALPPELRSHWAGLAELRNHAAHPVNRTPVQLDGVDNLLQARGHHRHPAPGQLLLHPADGRCDLGARLHPPQLCHDALPIEPEQVEPGDGIDHVADAGLTPLGVVEHAGHIKVVVLLDSGMPVEERITIVDDLHFGRRGHHPWIFGQGLPVLHWPRAGTCLT